MRNIQYLNIEYAVHGVCQFMIMQNKVKIFYLGSGAFSVPVLDALTRDDRIELLGIGTQVDKAAGRKRILTPTPLGKWCDERNISCMRVPSVNAPESRVVVGIFSSEAPAPNRALLACRALSASSVP